MDNKKLHLEALVLFQKMEAHTTVVAAKRTMWHYNERRKEATKALRPILTEMQTKFEAGEQIAGCDSMKDYCASFKNQGALTYARCRQIITGKSGNEGKVKSLDLKEGMIVRIPVIVDDNGTKIVMKFRVDSLPHDIGEFRSPRSKSLKGRRFASVTLEVIEEPKETKTVYDSKCKACKDGTCKKHDSKLPVWNVGDPEPELIHALVGKKTKCGALTWKKYTSTSVSKVTCPHCLTPEFTHAESVEESKKEEKTVPNKTIHIYTTAHYQDMGLSFRSPKNFCGAKSYYGMKKRNGVFHRDHAHEANCADCIRLYNQIKPGLEQQEEEKERVWLPEQPVTPPTKETHLAANRRRTVCKKPIGAANPPHVAGRMPTCAICLKAYRQQTVRQDFIHAIKSAMGLLAGPGDPMGTAEKRMIKEQEALFDKLVETANTDATVQGWFSGDTECSYKQLQAWVDENLNLKSSLTVVVNDGALCETDETVSNVILNGDDERITSL